MTRSRTVLILAVFVTLGVYALMRFQGSSSHAAPPTLDVRDEEIEVFDPTPELEEVDVVTIETPRKSEDRISVSATPEPATETEPISKQATFTLELQGTIVGSDVEGNEWSDIDGVITFFVSWDRGAHHYEASFQRGAWSTSIDSPSAIDELSIEKLLIHGQLALLEAPRGDLPLPVEGDLEIRARMPQSSTLRVVDTATGQELSGVQIVSAQTFPRLDDSHPGIDYSNRIVASDLVSPVELAPYTSALRGDHMSRVRGYATFLVGAEGYAWARVNFDFVRGGEKEVSLRHGSTLAINVRGVDASARAKLRLRPGHGYHVASEVNLTRDGLIEFHRLAPSNIRITAEVGDTWESPVVLGETSIELRGDERFLAELTLDRAPAFETVTANGVIHLAQDWNPERKENVMVSLDFQGTPLAGFDDHQNFQAVRIEPTLEGFDTFSWTTGELQVGKYTFHLYQLPLDVEFDLPKGGVEPFEWTLPPPVELLLRVRDEATLEDVTVDTVRWAPLRSEGLDIWHSTDATYDREQRRYVIRSPESQIDLETWSEEFERYAGTFDLRTGVLEHTIHLKRSFGVVVRLESGGRPISFPEPEGAHAYLASGFDYLTAVSGKGRVMRTRNVDFGRRLTVNELGTYVLALPEIPGFRLPAPQVVQVSSSGFTEVVVALERE